MTAGIDDTRDGTSIKAIEIALKWLRNEHPNANPENLQTTETDHETGKSTVSIIATTTKGLEEFTVLVNITKRTARLIESTGAE